MYFKNILLDIREHLGPHMKEADVVLRLRREEEFTRLTFERPGPQGWRSRLVFLLPVRSDVRQEQLAWENVRIGAQWVDPYDIGTNGWQGYYVNDVVTGEADGTREEKLAWAAKILQTPLWPSGRDVPNFVNSEHLEETWRFLVQEMEELGIDDACIDRGDDGVERLSAEYEGRCVVVEFPVDEMEDLRLFVDRRFLRNLNPSQVDVARTIAFVLTSEPVNLDLVLPPKTGRLPRP